MPESANLLQYPNQLFVRCELAPKCDPGPIPQNDHLDYLGVTIDHKLAWSTNSKQKISKAKKATGSITRLVKNRIHREQLRILLVSKVVPVFTYGLTVTYPRNKGDRISLERLNRFVVRLSTNDYVTPYRQLLNRTGMIPIYQSVLHRRIQLMQQYYRGKRYLPPNTIQPLRRNNILRRRHQDYAITTTESTGLRYSDSALELATQVWNRVPDNLVSGNVGNIRNRLGPASYMDNVWNICADMSTAILTL